MAAAAPYTLRTAREVLARVRELNPTPSLTQHERPDLGFVSILYSGQGCLTYPALGFYAVSLRFDGAGYLHEEGWSRGAVEARAGAVFVQAPNRMVEYAWQAQHLGWAMCVEPCEVERAAQELEILNPQRIEILSRASADSVAERLVRALGAQARLNSYPGQALASSALSKAMAVHLLSGYGVCQPRTAGRSGQKLSGPALHKAVAYLEENLERPCQLADLAAVSGVSSFSIDKQFRRTLGLSPARYVMRARVERAKHMLLRSRSESRVASQLGFADNLTFRKIFQRFTGVSPEYFSLLHGRRLDPGPAPCEKLS